MEEGAPVRADGADQLLAFFVLDICDGNVCTMIGEETCSFLPDSFRLPLQLLWSLCLLISSYTKLGFVILKESRMNLFKFCNLAQDSGLCSFEFNNYEQFKV